MMRSIQMMSMMSMRRIMASMLSIYEHDDRGEHDDRDVAKLIS